MSHHWLSTAACALVVFGATDVAGRSRIKEIPVENAPHLTAGLKLEARDGSELDLSTLRGERTLVLTWASW